MRGADIVQESLFSIVHLETFVPTDHALRPIKMLVDEVLGKLNWLFDSIYSDVGRESIPPERLIRAQLLQVLYSIRSERHLVEQTYYNLLYCWFIGLTIMGHTVMENRNGIVVQAEASQATGTAEREITGKLLDQLPGKHRKTVGADKNYDTKNFVAACREKKITPHVARNDKRRGGSAIDGRTSSRAGYQISQKIRKRVEEPFGWGKTVGMIRQLKVRGLKNANGTFKMTVIGWNLVRMCNLQERYA